MATWRENKKERNREWMRRYRATPEGRAASAAAKRRHYAKHGRAKKRVADERYNKSEKGRETKRRAARKRYSWERHIKRTYDVTADQFLAMATNGCMICGKQHNPHGGRNDKLHIDHDHSTGKVRGILCQGCNAGIGYFTDSIEKLAKAIEYLSRSP